MVFDLRQFVLLGVVAALHSPALLGAVQTAATSSLRPTTQDRSCAETTSRDQFTAFFQRAEGQWQVSIRDFDEQGRSTSESRQVRVFQRAIGGRYVEERGLVERNGGALVGLGLMLYSFDDGRSSVLMTSFWPGSPRRWAEFEGCLIDTVNPRLTGTLRSYRPGEAERTRRIELGFASSGQLLWRSYAAGTGGTDYLAEELVYTRAPTGPEQLGDMDALLGPATRVNQGVGMTSEIRAALSPSEPHSFLGSLVGAPVW